MHGYVSLDSYNQLKDKYRKVKNTFENAKEVLSGFSMIQCDICEEEDKRNWINEDEWCSQCSLYCCYDNSYDDNIDEGKCSAECITCKNMFCIKCVNLSTTYKCYKCIHKSENKSPPWCKYQYIHGKDKGRVCENSIDLTKSGDFCLKCLERPEIKFYLKNK